MSDIREAQRAKENDRTKNSGREPIEVGSICHRHAELQSNSDYFIFSSTSEFQTTFRKMRENESEERSGKKKESRTKYGAKRAQGQEQGTKSGCGQI
jgi:hypothetical protein